MTTCIIICNHIYYVFFRFLLFLLKISFVLIDYSSPFCDAMKARADMPNFLRKHLPK